MTASLTLNTDPAIAPAVRYLLRIADTQLILAQRLAEWCGHAPILEEDLALTNMALDLIGQARAVLTRAGQIDGQGFDEDQLAFLRDEPSFFNATLVELPRGDFALTVLRNFFVATWSRLLWEQLAHSSDAEVSAIAGKAVKEARYHQQHAADWVLRLAGGTAESRRRLEEALATLWRYTSELFDADAIDAQASASGLGPSFATLQAAWQGDIGAVFGDAGLGVPAASAFRGTGRHGVHSEHMGRLLAEMQTLQRSYPDGVW